MVVQLKEAVSQQEVEELITGLLRVEQTKDSLLQVSVDVVPQEVLV